MEVSFSVFLEFLVGWASVTTLYRYKYLEVVLLCHYQARTEKLMLLKLDRRTIDLLTVLYGRGPGVIHR